MSGLERHVIYGVTRLESAFADGDGNQVRAMSGTGFWVQTSTKKLVFVTNRHNFDPSIWDANRDLTLKSARLEFRRTGPSGERLDETTFVDLPGIHGYLRIHPNADCALLVDVRDPIPDGFGVGTSFAISMVADQAFLAEKAQLMDLASFIGFPGRPPSGWWDHAANLPISRLASLASDPGRPFVNPAISTADVGLVSGLSMSGSSGSPLILHEKGIPVAPPITGGYFVPPRILGIMSGHLTSEEPQSRMFQQTGLSYFTRSTSILELLREVDR